MVQVETEGQNRKCFVTEAIDYEAKFAPNLMQIYPKNHQKFTFSLLIVSTAEYWCN